MIWAEFAGLAAVVAVAGYWLSRFGDVIAERTGLSGSWVGMVLLATVTSLPELVSGLSSVTIVGSADLAVGDVLGSCLFNLLLLAFVDLAYRPHHMFARASSGHVLSIGFGIVMLGVVGLSIAVNGAGIRAPQLRIDVGTAALAVLYLLALRSIFTYERRRLLEPAEKAVARYPHLTLRRAVLGYAVAAACVVAAGVLLPPTAIQLAAAMGWSSTYVGTMFLAAATSMPELAVTLSAVRIGALDMAIASLLGSNLFNMAVLTIDDLAYRGLLLSDASNAHTITIFSIVAMNGLVVAGLIYRPAHRAARTVSLASLGLLATYGLNAWLLWLVAGS